MPLTPGARLGVYEVIAPLGSGGMGDVYTVSAEATRSPGVAGGQGLGLAMLAVQLGQTDRAFDWLEQGYREHDLSLTLLNAQPWLEPLNGDPRFKDLVRRIGIPNGSRSNG